MIDGYVLAFANTGRLFYPIASWVQLSLFLVAAGMFAAGTPDRALRVAQWVVAPSADIARLLSRLPSELLALINALPARDAMTFMTDRTECVVCSATLEAAPHAQVTTARTRYASRPRLLSARGERLDAIMHQKNCPSCDAVHYISYAQGGKILGDQQQFYQGCVDARFFHVSPHAIVETSLLVDFETQALFSHTPFLSFLQEYVFKYGDLPNGAKIDRARRLFSHLFYAWTLLRWNQECGVRALLATCTPIHCYSPSYPQPRSPPHPGVDSASVYRVGIHL